MTNFFQNQTFGDDFFRRQGPAGAAILSQSSGAVRDAHPIAPGANDANGNYVIDTPAFSNFVSFFLLLRYTQLSVSTGL
jgi:hypothetical protein